jgi:hypothetical protein
MNARMPQSQAREWVGLVVLLGGLGLWVLGLTVADPDLWGHVRFGIDLLETRTLHRADPYGYLTGEIPWVNHEWMAEAAMASAYLTAGPAGLVALKMTVALGLLLGSLAWLGARGVPPVRAAILVILLLVPLRMGLGTVRPQLFTYAFWFVLLMVFDALGRGRWLWALLVPPMMALWANLHGGVLAGAGAIGLWAAVELVGRIRKAPFSIREIGAIAGVTVASLAAILANPYGGELVTFLLRTATVPRPEINEWAPVRLTSVPGLWQLGLSAVALAAMIASRLPRNPGTIAVLVAALLLPLVAQRHLPLAAIAVIVLAGPHAADAWSRWVDRGNMIREPSRSRRVAGLVAGVLGVLLGLGGLLRFGRISLDAAYFDYPAQAIGLIRASGVTGNLLLPFNWGEYAIWHLAPRVRVGMDGRRETVYSDATYAAYLDFIQGQGAWSALVDRPETDLVLVDTQSPPANLMRLRGDWVRVYEDAVAALFARQGSPLIAPLGRTRVVERPVDGTGLGFPDGPTPLRVIPPGNPGSTPAPRGR